MFLIQCPELATGIEVSQSASSLSALTSRSIILLFIIITFPITDDIPVTEPAPPQDPSKVSHPNDQSLLPMMNEDPELADLASDQASEWIEEASEESENQQCLVIIHVN